MKKEKIDKKSKIGQVNDITNKKKLGKIEQNFEHNETPQKKPCLTGAWIAANKIEVWQTKKFLKSDKKHGKKANFSTFFLKLVTGAALGFVNGFFGGGGGMICVPILSRFFKLKKQSAHATSLAVILPLSLVSGIVYLTKNQIPAKNILFAGFALAIGAAAGAFFLKKIPPKALRIIFAILMFSAGLSMVIL